MPAKNVIKIQAPESYYHVYARGSNKQKLFLQKEDFKHFILLFERYLGSKLVVSSTGVGYPNFRDSVELLAYCLMQNHFHLLVYQKDVPYLEKLMRSLMTSYSRYFNLKYKRSGSVFESRYKAVRIDNDTYLQHISRYIHLNPRYWKGYTYSSYKCYVQKQPPEWLKPDKIKGLFRDGHEYAEFVADYEKVRDTLAEIKDQLANRN
jgi:putative transposase